MSITFSFEGMPTVEEKYGCCDDKSCIHCHGQGSIKFKHGQYELNVSTVNAHMLLTFLGLPQEYGGEWSAEDLLHKTTDKLLLQAKPNDYTLRRLQQLHELARQALKFKQTKIHWG